MQKKFFVSFVLNEFGRSFFAVRQFELKFFAPFVLYRARHGFVHGWYMVKTSFPPNSNKQNNLSRAMESYSPPTSLLIENQKERSAAKEIYEQEYER
jgi:hypothetical protein